MENEYKSVYKGAEYFSYVLLVFVFVGFFRTYFGLVPHFNEKVTTLIHFHFVFLMSWVLLLVIQPLLIRYKKVKTHRLLGKVTYFLAPLIVVSLISLMVRYYNTYHMETFPLRSIIRAEYSQGIHTAQFITFYILGLVNKQNIIKHASYMTATGIIFINPSLTRALGLFGFDYPVAETIVILFTDVTIFTFLFYAKNKGINYKPYLIIFLIFQLHDIPMLTKIWL